MLYLAQRFSIHEEGLRMMRGIIFTVFFVLGLPIAEAEEILWLVKKEGVTPVVTVDATNDRKEEVKELYAKVTQVLMDPEWVRQSEARALSNRLEYSIRCWVHVSSWGEFEPHPQVNVECGSPEAFDGGVLARRSLNTRTSKDVLKDAERIPALLQETYEEYQGIKNCSCAQKPSVLKSNVKSPCR
jgi:hypothetical protein